MLSIRYTLSSILFLLFSALFVYSCTTEPPKIYTLTTEAEPVEGGTVTPSNVEIEEKESIQITATPKEHWLFKGWAGDITGVYQQTANVYMDQDRRVTALFERMVYPVTVTIVGEGEVYQEIVQEKAIDDEFESETILRLTAEPKPGWKLAEWNGEINGSTEINTNDPVIEITVVGPIDIVVKFEKIDYLLSVNIEGRGSVEQKILASSVIETEYPFETVVELKATPLSSWKFKEWSGEINSTDNIVVVSIDKDKEVTATFVELPTMSTKPITAITINSAVSGGSFTNNSNVTTIDKGICWSTINDTNPETNPDIDCKSADPETNTFDLLMDDLKSNTKYYVRAVAEYSINSNKVVLLGNERSFTTETESRLPSIITTSITSITQNSAMSGGTVTDIGISPVTQRGICWKNSPDPTTADNCTSQGTGSGAFATEITGLITENNYWVRAYATNVEGTTYGQQVSFTTLATASAPPPPTTPPPTPPPPPPSGGSTTILVMFSPNTLANSGTSTGAVDVNVNGTWYYFSSSYAPTASLYGVGTGVVININAPLTYFALNPNQIRTSGLNNDCYGLTTIKMMKKHPEFNPNHVNGDPGSVSYWASSHNSKGQLFERGSINYMLDEQNPTFYQQQVPADWSNSGKFMFWIEGVGVNHTNYNTNINPLLGVPGLYPTGRTLALPACN